MTKDSLEKTLASIKADIRDTVVSYFAPVRAVVREVSESVSTAAPSESTQSESGRSPQSQER